MSVWSRQWEEHEQKPWGKKGLVEGLRERQREGGGRIPGGWSGMGPDQAGLLGWRGVRAASWGHWGVMAGFCAGSYKHVSS